jgi:hypothetical protein
MATLSAPTLQNLITNVRSLLNQPDSNNSFWRDTELTEWLNEGVRLYFNEIVNTDEGHFVALTDLNIVTDTETVALPSDCFKIRSLYKKVINGYEMLPYRNNHTESYSTQGGTSSNSYLPYYYFRANNIVLRPIPNFSETAGLRLEYVQFPDTMVNGGDGLTTQVSPIFKNVIEMYAVYKAKLKESLVNGVNTYSGAESNLGVLVKQFRDTIEQRSKNPTYIIPWNPEFGG